MFIALIYNHIQYAFDVHVLLRIHHINYSCRKIKHFSNIITYNTLSQLNVTRLFMYYRHETLYEILVYNKITKPKYFHKLNIFSITIWNL